MGRPRLVVRRLARPVQMPEDLSNRIDLLLWSPLEGRVPYGAFSDFVCAACREKLERIAQEAKFAKQLEAEHEE